MVCLRLPVLEDSEENDDPVNNGAVVLSRYPRWFRLGHIETQQCDLATSMLSAASGELLFRGKWVKCCDLNRVTASACCNSLLVRSADQMVGKGTLQKR